MNVPERNCAFVVVGRPLEQHRADALGDAAAHLAVDDRRVDERAAVLDDDVALDRARCPVSTSTSTIAQWVPPDQPPLPPSNSRVHLELGSSVARGGDVGQRRSRSPGRRARRPCRRRSRGRSGLASSRSRTTRRGSGPSARERCAAWRRRPSSPPGCHRSIPKGRCRCRRRRPGPARTAHRARRPRSGRTSSRGSARAASGR